MAWQVALDLCGVAADLVSGYPHRALGRISDDFPCALFEYEFCVVACEKGGGQFQQGFRVFGAGGLTFEENFAVRSIAFAGDCKALACHKQLAHGHFSKGECASLVGADHIRGPQRFYGGKSAHERPASRHAHDAEREGHGHHCGHAFRNGGHGEAHRCHEHLKQPRAAQKPQQEQKRDDAECHPGEHASE